MHPDRKEVVIGLAAQALLFVLARAYLSLPEFRFKSGLFYFFLVAFVVGVLARLYVVANRWGTIPDPTFCSTCGYNLTGNVSGVCFERGNKITQS